MRFLRVLGLVLVDARGIGHIGGTEGLADLGTGGGNRLGRHVDAVGPHVGDVPGLIEPLCRRHRGLGPHAVFPARLLLQGRGHEGRERVARGGLGLHRFHCECSILNGGDREFRRFGGRDVEFFQLAPAQHRQPCGQLGAPRRGKGGGHGPVFAGLEGLDLHLALYHEAQDDRLHPPGRFRPRQLAPQHRRQGKAHEIIQRAAGEVCLDQRGIDLPGRGHGGLDRGFGDGVEGNAADLLAFLQAGGQRFGQVPGNRLAFAVGVGGEDQLVIGLERLGNCLDMSAAVGSDFPGHGKVMLGIDRAVLGRQVAHMTVRGQNRETGAEVLRDGLGLGRGFDDDDCHGYGPLPAGCRVAPDGVRGAGLSRKRQAGPCNP